MKSSQPFLKRASSRWMGAILAVLLGWCFYIPTKADYDPLLTRASYDWLLDVREEPAPPTNIVVILQGDESHKQLNQPHSKPWDRKLHAALLRRLQADRSSLVIFDLVFDEASDDPKDDDVFAAAIRAHGKVILGSYSAESGEAGFLSGVSVKPPIDSLATNAAATAIAKVTVSNDRIVRKLHLGETHGAGGDAFPTFAWKAAEMLAAPVAKDFSIWDRQIWVNYYGPPATIQTVEYVNALSNYPAGYFRDKIVLIGPSATIGYSGAGRDSFANPFGGGKKEFPGVELHAISLANVLRGEWLHTASHAVEALLLALFGLCFGRMLLWFRPLWATAMAVAAVVLIVLAVRFLVGRHHFWFPWAIVVCVQIPVALGWSVLFHWIQSQLQSQFLEQSLSMYLSPKLVKQFSRDKDLSLLQPGAKKQKLTIMFSDIANFTSISEGMDSDELAKMMNEYFQSAVDDCVHAHDGTVVKYIGDAIFAFWNAPEPQADHAARACAAAMRFRRLSSQELRGKKLVTRIGLHTGTANVGNFGSGTRVDYTAIGEDINLASRMEGLNKYLGTTVLITGDVRKELGDLYITRYLGRFQLKGFERAVEVHELTGPADAPGTTSFFNQFDQAVRLFQKGDLEAAESLFSRVQDALPHDGPVKFYLKHLHELRAAPLPDGWAGEVELKEK